MFTSKYAYKMATKKFDLRRARKKHIGVNLFSTDGMARSENCIAILSEHNWSFLRLDTTLYTPGSLFDY